MHTYGWIRFSSFFVMYTLGFMTLGALSCGCDESEPTSSLDQNDMVIAGSTTVGSVTAGSTPDNRPEDESEVAGESIAGTSTAGASIAGEFVAGDSIAGESSLPSSCEPSRPPHTRMVAVGFPFGAEIGISGQDIGFYQLNPDGEFYAWGDRVDIGFRPKSLTFSEDGWWALALSEEGELATIDLRDEPRLATRIEIVDGYFNTIQSADKPRRFDLINGDNDDEDAGLYMMHLGCDGEIELEMSHYYLRLIQGFKRFTGQTQEAVIFGGQALFDPIDLIDVRWVQETDQGWDTIAQADVFEDHIDAINVGLSPRGDWIAVVNGSPFTDEGGQVRFISIDRTPPQLRQSQIFEGYQDVRGIWFLPDGSAALITQFEVGQVQAFVLEGAEWVPGLARSGLGLAEDLAVTPAPEPQEGWWAIVPNTSPTGGSQLTPLHVLPGGAFTTLSSTSLGSTSTDLPGPIAAWPPAE